MGVLPQLFLQISAVFKYPPAEDALINLVQNHFAAASALYLILVSLLSFSLAAYSIWALSDPLSAVGSLPGDAVRSSMLFRFALAVLPVVWLYEACRLKHLDRP